MQPQQSESITVPAGQSLLVVANEDGTGQIARYPISMGEAPLAVEEIVANEDKQFGPYVEPMRYVIACYSGAIGYSVKAVEITDEDRARQQVQGVTGEYISITGLKIVNGLITEVTGTEVTTTTTTTTPEPTTTTTPAP